MSQMISISFVVEYERKLDFCLFSLAMISRVEKVIERNISDSKSNRPLSMKLHGKPPSQYLFTFLRARHLMRKRFVRF